MPDANYDIGDHFPIQFAWRLPNNDYLRAVFDAEVVEHVPKADKYVLYLHEVVGGRQENPDGELRPTENFDTTYWSLVHALPGQRIAVAYEVDDGRALHLRLATLTGEHDYFTRWRRVPPEWFSRKRNQEEE